MKCFINYHPEQLKWVKNDLLPQFDALSVEYLIDYNSFNPNLPEIINIKRALEDCDTIVLLLDYNYINSKYKELDQLIQQFGNKFTGRESIICIRRDKTKLPRKLYKFLQFEFFYPGQEKKEFDNLGTYLQKKVATVPNLFESKDQYKSFYQPVYHEYFCGREKELRILSDWFNAGDINLIAMTGGEGIGKTSLLQKSLSLIQEKFQQNFDKIFFWSFAGRAHYQDSQSLIEEFFDEAFKWFGATFAKPKNMYAQGAALAKLVNQKKTLLILDSLEVGQYEKGRFQGSFLDRGFYTLLRQLSVNNRGLCIVTSRIELKDIGSFNRNAIRSLVLTELKPESAAELLRSLGIKGEEITLYEVLKDFGTNPLVLKILSSFLNRFFDGVINKTYRLPQVEFDETESIPIVRVLKPIDQALAGLPELNLLRIFCLFNYTVDLDAAYQFAEKPVIPGFNESIVEDESLKYPEIIDNLVKLNLAFYDEDGHCFVRNSVQKYIVDTVLTGMKEELEKAHGRLYKYYKNLSKADMPVKLSEMKPFLTAVMHGCLSGKTKEVYQNIYLKKITRNNQYFILHRLKAYGNFISIISNFYDKSWQQVSMQLKEALRTSVLGASGYALKAVGRFREAAQTMQAGLDILIRIQDWKDAAISAESISELYLKLGEVSTSVDMAHMSLDFADLSEDTFHKWSKRCTFANALFLSGKTKEARDYFYHAESILKDENPDYLLYGLAGFYYCRLLLHFDKHIEVIERANRVLSWMADDYWLLGKALDWLSIGNAHLLAIEKFDANDFDLAEEYINKSLEALSTEGYEDYYVLALLAKARYYRLKELYKEAGEMLGQAYETAEQSGLELDKIDCLIEEIQLNIALKKLQKGFETFIKVREQVETNGYILKQTEVSKLRALLRV